MITDLRQVNKAYFLGLGGIGVSALARMFLAEGKQVSGSDASESYITEELRKLGIDVFIGQDITHIPTDTDLVIYTIAIPHYAKAFFEEVKAKFQVLSYPEVLGLISKDKYTIAVAGTHGKTTTTAMIAEMMIGTGLDPTVVVGSLLSKYKSNFVAGKSEYFVVEACEYQNSFLNISPRVAIVTNIDNDHLDFFGNEEKIIESFGIFLKAVPADGFIICDKQDKKIKNIIEDVPAQIIDYTKFLDPSIELKVFGEHNRKNAACALALSSILKINEDEAKKALINFTGTWRRFEYKGETKEGAKVYDDYGHHPTEIKATLQGAKELVLNGKIFVIFEPHLFSRTKLLLNDFAECFKGADEVVITPIYPAREVYDATISSEMLVEKIQNTKAQYEDSYQSASDYITNKAKKGDVIVVMGAGNITKVAGLLTGSRS